MSAYGPIREVHRRSSIADNPTFDYQVQARQVSDDHAQGVVHVLRPQREHIKATPDRPVRKRPRSSRPVGCRSMPRPDGPPLPNLQSFQPPAIVPRLVLGGGNDTLDHVGAFRLRNDHGWRIVGA